MQKSVLKRLVEGTFNYGFGNFLPRIIGFLLIPVYTLYLSPKDYGIIELAASLSGFCVPLMRIGLPGSVNRYYFNYRDKLTDLQAFITSVHKLLLLGSLVSGTIATVALLLWGDFLLPGLLFWPYIILSLATSMFAANSNLQRRVIQAREQSGYAARLSLVFGITGLLLSLLLVMVFEMGALGVLVAQLINGLAFFVQSQIYLSFDLKAAFNPTMALEAIKYGSGLFPHHLLVAASPLIAKSILAGSKSVAAVGIFSLALRFILPLNLVNGAFKTAFQPIYFSLRKEAEEVPEKFLLISKLRSLAWYGGIAVFSLAVLFFPLLIPMIVPESFHDSGFLVPILAIGFLGQLLYFLLLVEFFYLEKTFFAPIITGIGLVVNVVLAYYYIDRWGPVGLSWAQSIGFLTWGLIAMIIYLSQAPTELPKSIWIGLILSALVFSADRYFELTLGSRLLLLGIATLPFLLTVRSIREN